MELAGESNGEVVRVSKKCNINKGKIYVLLNSLLACENLQ